MAVRKLARAVQPKPAAEPEPAILAAAGAKLPMVRGWLSESDHDEEPNRPAYIAFGMFAYNDQGRDGFIECRDAVESDLAALGLTHNDAALRLAEAVLAFEAVRRGDDVREKNRRYKALLALTIEMKN